MNLPDIPGWLKLSTTHLAAVSLVTGALLFAPLVFLKSIGVDRVVNTYRMWVGLAFLASSGVVLSRGIAEGIRWLRKRASLRARRKREEARLHNLSPQEAFALAGYVHGRTRTQYFKLEDGMINGLQAEGIVYRASTLSIGGTTFAYNIQPWALDYLTKNPHLLPTPEELQVAATVARRSEW